MNAGSGEAAFEIHNACITVLTGTHDGLRGREFEEGLPDGNAAPQRLAEKCRGLRRTWVRSVPQRNLASGSLQALQCVKALGLSCCHLRPLRPLDAIARSCVLASNVLVADEKANSTKPRGPCSSSRSSGEKPIPATPRYSVRSGASGVTLASFEMAELITALTVVKQSVPGAQFPHLSLCSKSKAATSRAALRPDPASADLSQYRVYLAMSVANVMTEDSSVPDSLC